MLKSRKFCRAVIVAVIAGLFVTSMPMPRAQAALVTSEDLATQRSVAADRARINELMAREDVQRELKTYGISSDEAQARVNSLTDEEVMQVAGRLDQLPAGQSALGAILGVALIVFIVLLITDIAGLTKVFPWTRSVR
jgi:hypothetical protein